MKNVFYILLLDIIASTKSKDRPLITEKLNEAILKANQMFKDEYYAPFEITKGDEVAVVLFSIKHAYDMIILFNTTIFPEKMRAVICYDKLTAGLNSKRSTIIDGPGFYKANELMIQLKKSDKYFAISSGNNNHDGLINTFFNMFIHHWYGLTKFQREVIRLYQRDKNQTKVANLLNRKQQQIQNTLSRCKWEIINDVEKTISELFQIIDHNNRK